MRNLPTSADARGRTFTLADFLEAGQKDLQLEVLSDGRGLSHAVLDPATNRPGLALTGFFESFGYERLQVFGYPEVAYLRSLSVAERRVRVSAMLDHGAYCFIFTNGERLDDEIASFVGRSGAVVLATPLKTREFTHRATYVLERLAAPRTTIYGTMVEVCGIGVLFEGDPGLGKSETALGLIKRGAALVADDLTCIRKAFGCEVLYGSAADSTAGFMEIRGIGIIHIPSMFGVNAVRGEKRLQLVISFRLLNQVKDEIDRIGQTRRYRDILGVKVPNVIIPVSEGRDLVNLVETAAQRQKLLMTGYDPVECLSERLRVRVDGNNGGGGSNGRENH